MSVITCVLILTKILVLCGGTCVDRRTKDNNWEMKLRKDLIKDYFVYEPPKGNMDNCSRVNVELLVVLMNAKFDSDSGKMTLYSKLLTVWKDQRMTWNPKEYGNITRTYINGKKIWTPEFTFFDTVFDKHNYKYCHLVNNKTVISSQKYVYDIICILSGSNWPYDRQSCVLVIGALPTSPITLRHRHEIAPLPDRVTQVAGGWDFIDILFKNETSSNSVRVEFVIERRASSMSTFIVFPCKALSILTLSSLCLDFRNTYRLFAICFSLISHLYFLTILAENIPIKFLDTPTILLYLRGSLVLTALNVICLFSLTVLYKRDGLVPSRIIFVSEYIYNSRLKYFLPVIDDNAKWLKFVYILNICLILITVFVYITMYFAFIPTAYTYYNNIVVDTRDHK